MSSYEDYNEALARDDIHTCIAIEESLGLYGYSPELVSVGLDAIDEGDCPYEAIENFLGGGW